MLIALEVRGLAKRFTVGIGGCLASADVLRGIDLTVRAGEALAIVGDAGSGKSTLLLCLAGLLTPDAGHVSWFGDSSRSAGARRVVYHVTRTDLMRAGCTGEPNVHLVDVRRGMETEELDRWIDVRRGAGDAVVVAARDADWMHLFGPRVMTLRRGMLHDAAPRPWIRVAETVHH